MFYLILAGLLVLAIVVAVLVGLFGPKERPAQGRRGQYDYDPGSPSVRKPALIGAAALTALLLLLTFLFSITTVSARAVGIETSFGRYTDTLGPGFQLTAPYASVEEFSTQIQTAEVMDIPVSFAGVKTTDKDGKEIESGSGGSGDADSVVRYAITEQGAENLWRKYRTFENVTNNLVLPTVRESMRVQVGAYSPVEAKDGSNLRPINEAIKADLERAFEDDGIVIDSVSITDVALGKSAQSALDRIVEANANTERALAEEQRAIIDARTLATRKNAGANEPDALARYCLEVTNAWNVAENGPLPATWNCMAASASVTPVLPVK